MTTKHTPGPMDNISEHAKAAADRINNPALFLDAPVDSKLGFDATQVQQAINAATADKDKTIQQLNKICRVNEDIIDSHVVSLKDKDAEIERLKKETTRLTRAIDCATLVFSDKRIVEAALEYRWNEFNAFKEWAVENWDFENYCPKQALTPPTKENTDNA